MLLDVLTEVASDTGMDLVQKRAVLLSLANRAAKTMADLLECNKMYREVTLVVQPDKVVSLPSYIGELRGMRMHTNELPFDLHSLSSPRYVANTLQFKFKNWRDKGESAISQFPSVVGPLQFTCVSVESTPVVILVSGQTANSQRVEESVTVNGVSKFTTNSFGPQIYSISCVSKREYNIRVLDVNGNEIAILYNNYPKTRYKIVDVSQIFWTLDSTDGGSLIDVCYKVPTVQLFRDTDSFFAGDDYDEAWYNMCMHLYYKPIQNRQADSQAFYVAALALINAAKDSSESGILKKLSFGRNKFFGIFRKFRYYPGSVTNVDHNVQN